MYHYMNLKKGSYEDFNLLRCYNFNSFFWFVCYINNRFHFFDYYYYLNVIKKHRIMQIVKCHPTLKLLLRWTSYVIEIKHYCSFVSSGSCSPSSHIIICIILKSKLQSKRSTFPVLYIVVGPVLYFFKLFMLLCHLSIVQCFPLGVYLYFYTLFFPL